MRTITMYLVLLILSIATNTLSAQTDRNQKKIELLQSLKDDIIQQEKEGLKLEVEEINERLKRDELAENEAKILKEDAAKKRALNIENRIAIVDNKIALLSRNENDTFSDSYGLDDNEGVFKVDVNGENWFTIREKDIKKEVKYDRRTYVDPVIAIGLNNAIVDGQSLEDTPYKVGGSRFFELGWAWRTRVFKNSNALRFNYGLSFQFNGLKPKDNNYFVVNNGQTELEEFEFDLNKSKLQMNNLVFPVHFEFGPSKRIETEKKMRYSLRNQFRFGIGGYGGFNLGTRQKLKYRRDGERVKDKLKRDYNTSDFIYGLSAYAGFDGIQLYVKYDLNPIFQNASVEQHNVSLGLRFDLDD